MEYFQKAVMPLAEKASVKMALRPDDPPISPLRGIGRILTSACQANFKAMGKDIESVAKEWCGQKKIFFVHFRDIEGQGKHFSERFHDDGPTDMGRMLKV